MRSLIGAGEDEPYADPGLQARRSAWLRPAAPLFHGAHLPSQLEWLRQDRHHQSEQERCSDRQRALRLYEGPPLRDVLGVIVKERVQPFVLDLQHDWRVLLLARGLGATVGGGQSLLA